MALISTTATCLICLLHIYIMTLEMFLWTAPRGRRTFGLTADFAEKTKALAANQGLYNGFLAAGLVWGLLHPVPEFALQLRVFFLTCVIVAGVYGAATANSRILFVQAIPGLVAIAAVIYG